MVHKYWMLLTSKRAAGRDSWICAGEGSAERWPASLSLLLGRGSTAEARLHQVQGSKCTSAAAGCLPRHLACPGLERCQTLLTWLLPMMTYPTPSMMIVPPPPRCVAVTRYDTMAAWHAQHTPWETVGRQAGPRPPLQWRPPRWLQLQRAIAGSMAQGWPAGHRPQACGQLTGASGVAWRVGDDIDLRGRHTADLKLLAADSSGDGKARLEHREGAIGKLHVWAAS